MRALFTNTFLMSLTAPVLTFCLHAAATDAAVSRNPEVTRELAVDNPPVIELMAINPVAVQVTLTDMSEEESLYEIYRSRDGLPAELVRSFAAPGSGGFYIVHDYPQPMVINAVWTYTINATVDGRVYPGVASATVNTANYNAMAHPELNSGPMTETSIALSFGNPVEGALTEIYRAPTHGGPFELIVTRSEPSGQFVDTGLTPGTTYHYTVRGILDSQVSLFAPIWEITTYYNYKVPDFSAEAMADGSVHITVHDHGLSDMRYELIRADGGTGDIIETFVMPDSGAVVNYVDDYVLPDITYVYFLDVFFEGGGGPTPAGIDTVTTFATEADLGYLYLVDPFSDTEMGYYVTDGFTNTFPDMSIVVQANELTSSVIFYLDGKKSVDNSPPFAVLPDVNGDFESLNLPNGTYELMAIAYPEQDGGGMATDTITVTFDVDIHGCIGGCFTLVNADTDADIGPIAEGQAFVKPAGSYFNVRFNPAYSPGSVEFRIENNIYRVENAPPFSLAGDLGGDYLPWKAGLAGTYYIEATPYTGPNRTGYRGQPVSITFTIVQPEITEPGFIIVNADTDEDLQPLHDGDLFLKPAGMNINIRYDAIDNPGSVVFLHQNKVVRTENAAPFAVRGDYNGNYLPWAVAVPGSHRIDATPYELDRGQGTEGPTSTVNFTIIEEDGNANTAGNSAAIAIYPNPARSGEAEITISGDHGPQRATATLVQIIDIAGNVIFSREVECPGDCGTYAVKVQQHLAPGVYIVRIKNSDQSPTSRRLLVKSN